VLLLGAIVVIYQNVVPLVSSPGRMRGGVNVAVAAFGGLDAQNRRVDLPRASELAQVVFTSLDQQVHVASGDGADLSIEVWGPSRTGHIEGATREERARQAEQKAHQIEADVIVYGTVQASAGVTTFKPEFYLASTKLLGGEELVGQYELGSPIDIRGDFTSNGAAFDELRRRVLARTRALEQFTYGIGNYERNEFGKAADHLTRAEQGWDDQDGKEVLYTLAGFATGRSENFDRAAEYFARALKLNPGYARARMGAAEILFQQVGAQRECASDRVDADGLQEALRGFEIARAAPLQPAESNIQSKVTFGFGQVYLCLSLARKQDAWVNAETQFRSVAAEYDAGNKRLKDLAAEAHGLLGFIAAFRTNAESSSSTEGRAARYSAASTEYAKAIDLSLRRDRQALFNQMQGYLQCRLGEWDLAAELYTRAIGLEPDPATQSSYQELLRKLQEDRICA
jgi:tetratricopeptide (TPR) repeat protein